MADYEVNYTADGAFAYVKVTHRNIRHANTGESVRFIIGTPSSYTKLKIQQNNTDSTVLFGYSEVSFGQDYNIGSTASGVYTYRPFIPGGGHVLPPDTGTIKVGG